MPSVCQHNLSAKTILIVATGLLAKSPAFATTFDDIGFTDLQNAVGMSIPDGADVDVTQVEADANAGETEFEYAPDPGLAEFAGKSIIDVSGFSTAFSGHANSVARIFFGNAWMAPGITSVDVFLADRHVNDDSSE